MRATIMGIRSDIRRAFADDFCPGNDLRMSAAVIHRDKSKVRVADLHGWMYVRHTPHV